MSGTKRIWMVAVGLLSLHSLVVSSAAAPMSYQGELRLNGQLAPAGSYDLRLRYFTSGNCDSGVQLGGDVLVTVSVSAGGLFSVVYDPPSGLTFDPNFNVYLEIAVFDPGSSTYVSLCPRNLVAASPISYISIRSTVAATSDTTRSIELPIELFATTPQPALRLTQSGPGPAIQINGLSDFIGPAAFGASPPFSVASNTLIPNLNAQLLSGRSEGFLRDATNLNAGILADVRLSTNVPRLNAAQTFTAANTFSSASNSFTGSGAGLTSLNAASVSMGTLNDARLSTNIPRNNASQNAFTGSASFAGALDVGGNVSVAGGISHANPLNFVGSAVEPILQINGVELIGRRTAQGAVTIGADDSLVIGDGESRGAVVANVDMTLENTYVSSDNSIFFYTNLQNGWAARNVVLFRDDGNVGVATTTPGSRLDVRATGARNAIAGYADTSNYSGVYGETSVAPLCNQETAAVKGRNPTQGVTGALARGSLSGTCEFPVYFGVYGQAGASDYAGYFDGPGYFSGNVGIGGINPSFKLHVAGNIRATGAVTASCGTLTCSDARFKKDVLPVAGALDKITRLCGVTFDWNREQFPEYNFVDGRQVGFIAQEVREVLPEVVVEGPDGYLSVDYARLTPVLVEALHDLRAEKDRQIADLTARLERLERTMSTGALIAADRP